MDLTDYRDPRVSFGVLGLVREIEDEIIFREMALMESSCKKMTLRREMALIECLCKKMTSRREMGLMESLCKNWRKEKGTRELNERALTLLFNFFFT